MTPTLLPMRTAPTPTDPDRRCCGSVAAAVALMLAAAAPAAFAQSSQDSQAGAPTTDPNSPVIHAGPVSLLFGGFSELAVIYRDKTETADVASNMNTGIPFPSSQLSDVSEFRETARQSRFSMLAEGDPYAGAKADMYFETDFLGAAPTANSQESNSYNLRVRQFFGQFVSDSGFSLTAGQAWSLATMYKQGLAPRSEDVPLTIDASYVVGFNWLRNPQIRFVEEFSKQFSLGFSIESPQTLLGTANTVPTTAQTVPGTTTTVTLSPYPSTAIYQNAGGTGYASTNNYSIDPAPDLILKAAADPGWGHYEVYGLARWFRSNLAGVNNTVSGGGVGAGLILPLLPSNALNFQASGLYGKGIGRYGVAQLPDVVVMPNGSLSTTKEIEYMLGLTYTPWSPLTAYVYAGREAIDANYADATLSADGATFGPYAYGYGSPLVNVSGCYTLGGKCSAQTASDAEITAGFWWKYYQGTLGNLQFGLQFEYVQRTAFEGKLSTTGPAAPDANIFITMASFRYYPFQK